MKKTFLLITFIVFLAGVNGLRIADAQAPTKGAMLAQISVMLDLIRTQLLALTAQVKSVEDVEGTVTLYGTNNSGIIATTSTSTQPGTTTPQQIPNPPSNLSASASGPNFITLVWRDNASNEQGFIVERGNDGIVFPVSFTIPASNATSYVDYTVLPSTLYAYRVRAYNAAGRSAPSNTAAALTPSGAPNQPSNLVANPSSPTQINLTWRDNSTNEDGFMLDRREGSGPWLVWRNLPTNTTFFPDTSLMPNTQYLYAVRSYNRFGTSTQSNIASSTTPGGPGTSNLTPQNLTATPLDLYRVLLNWEDRSTAEDGFLIERDTYPGSGYQVVGRASANTNRYEHLFFLDASTTRAATDYVYRIRAFNAASSSASAPAYARTRP